MSYESISFFSPVENPLVVSQVARTMQPEAKFVITAAKPNGPDISPKSFDGLIKFLFIAGIFALGFLAGKAIEEYFEKRRQKKIS
ncbi:MAG: hypothetical protein WC865_12690 [Bacteroidales bacterium]